jgi:hypothetical protein
MVGASGFESMVANVGNPPFPNENFRKICTTFSLISITCHGKGSTLKNLGGSKRFQVSLFDLI